MEFTAELLILAVTLEIESSIRSRAVFNVEPVLSYNSYVKLEQRLDEELKYAKSNPNKVDPSILKVLDVESTLDG